jgi:hypothetical protein
MAGTEKNALTMGSPSLLQHEYRYGEGAFQTEPVY